MQHSPQNPGFVAGCLLGTPLRADASMQGSSRTSLPPELGEHAVNVARWFPEVLLTLGAPDLEEHFVPSQARVLESTQGRTVEISLNRRHVLSASPPPQPHLGGYIGGASSGVHTCSSHPVSYPLEPSAATWQAVAMPTLMPSSVAAMVQTATGPHAPPSTSPHQTDVMNSLGKLAGDFESLAMRVTALAVSQQQHATRRQVSGQPCALLHAAASAPVTAAASMTQPHQTQLRQQQVNARLDVVEHDLLALTSMLSQRLTSATTVAAGPNPPPNAALTVSPCSDACIGLSTEQQPPQRTAPLAAQPVAAAMPQQVVTPAAVVKSSPTASSGAAQDMKAPATRVLGGIMGFASSPALLESSGMDENFIVLGRSANEFKETTVPGSARGGQAHQGALVDGAGRLGRSRNQSVATSSKAVAWRNERQSLQIHITKLHQLQQEPHSPKFVTRPRVWGRGSKNRAGSIHLDRSAGAIRERMEKRLAQLFGESKVDHFPRKHKSID